MTATTPRSVLGDVQESDASRRVIVYAVSRLRGQPDEYISLALRALRPLTMRIIVVVCGDVDASARSLLEALSDEVVVDGEFTPGLYKRVLDERVALLGNIDEVVLTGDSWFGPMADFAPIMKRMQGGDVDFWEMVENSAGAPKAFPEQGFPSRLETWTWTVVRRRLFSSRAWKDYWSSSGATHRAIEQESRFAAHFRAAGFVGGAAFASSDFGNDDPGVLSPDLLVQAGCPLVKRAPFPLYPPYLHQQAVIGRDVVATIAAAGYPLDTLWQHLARTVQPKALNTIAGMLEVPTGAVARSTSRTEKIVVVAHVSDVDQAPDLFRHLASLPPGYDLVVTTSDGRKAVTLSRMLEKRNAAGAGSVDVRVTPANRGRDMGDLFIACRDVLVPGRYDLVVKVHARNLRRKTMNVRRYFRRYQLDNLLGSPEHVAGILSLFDREPRLGLVFPPMMHIGYATMGRAWGAYRQPAQKLFAELGIGVPVDLISPLAPYGGMWFARPEALRLLSQRRWLYRDYGKPGRQRYRDLARLQERAVTYAAAELGFHSRTVLTPEHAAITHTALEFKADQLFSTTRGYPVDSILLIQRAGNTGYGGVVGLSRMYLRINHRILARVLLPILAGAQWAYSSVRGLMGDERFIRQRETWRDEDL